jgi:ribosomal protein S18 acetylase RimI-like enzyme
MIEYFEAAPEDIDDIISVEREYTSQFYPDSRIDEKERLDLLKSAFDDVSQRIIVAKYNGKFAGFAWVSEKESYGKKQGFIECVQVIPGMRGKGIGSRLLCLIQQHLRLKALI